MAPYYSDDSVTLYHGDCRQVIPRLPMVRLVLTDPPYGQEYVSNNRSQRFAPIIGDDASKTLDWLSLVAARHEPGGPLFVFCGEWGIDELAQALRRERYGLRRVIVWDKGGKMSQGDLENFGLRTEFIVFAGAGQDRPSLRGPRSSNVLSIPRIDGRLLSHPAEKPRALLEFLIARSTDYGDVVLDPFAGSGSTLRAAKDLGRRAIGVEIDEDYCRLAAKRCAQNVLAVT